MRLGLIVRADTGGLGAQTYELYNWLQPAKTMVVDISDLNGFPTDHRRYPGAQYVRGFPKVHNWDEFMQDLDVILTVEIPYGYVMFEMARQRHIKTVLQCNYEFMDHLNDPSLAAPDAIFAPSLWHYQDIEALADRIGAKCYYVPVPVNRERIPFKPRSGNHLLHIAGHKTFEDRNGTDIVLEAMNYVESEVLLTITTQHELAAEAYDDHRIQVLETDFDNYWDIWNQVDADILLLPRRYGGLSLQLNEAMAAGIVPIMTDVEPQSGFLPRPCLVPYAESKKIITRAEIGCYSVSPQALAHHIDLMIKSGSQEGLSHRVGELAEEISWKTMIHTYQAALEMVCLPR